MSKVIGDFIL